MKRSPVRRVGGGRGVMLPGLAFVASKAAGERFPFAAIGCMPQARPPDNPLPVLPRPRNSR